jgi:hypothetical protein
VARLALVLAFLALLAGCGGSQGGGAGDAGDALAYLPADATTVFLLSTEVDGEQWDRFDELIFRRLDEEEDEGPQTLEEALSGWAKDIGLDWEEDVKPLLGNDLAVAAQGEPLPFLVAGDKTSIMAALETRGGDIEEVLRKADFVEKGEANGAKLFAQDDDDPNLAVEDGVLVFAEDEKELREALERRDSGEGMDEGAVQDGLADLPSEAFVRGFGPLGGTSELEGFRRFADVPLVQALESWGWSARFSRDDLNVEIAVRLDEDRIDEADLPLVTGEESPEIAMRERELSGGNLNQSQTTVFLLRALRAGYPDSRFVKAAEAVERELGIDFEDEILRQFNGPSASYVSADGRTFAARSEVRDPEALREVLPRIAEHLPALVEGLQGLESEGMALLFLFAPDAPAAAPMSKVRVEPPASEDGLYRITGLTGDGPSELHLGLIDDLFVVASSEQLAREIAEAETAEAEGAVGAGVARINLSAVEDEIDAFGFLPITGKQLVASLEAATDELRARVRVELD